uniref:Protein kinase domain-containing protein n=1 Tax=Glossina pallidipes TaxID=7398 RepID=A0A1B0ABP3_GLOPL
MSSKTDDKGPDVPERLYDSSAGKTYKRMRFFGKSGFAKCYEIIDVATNEVYADTYSKIKKCDYQVPSYLRKSAADMIVSMLQSNPSQPRPTIDQLLYSKFSTSLAVPMFLPTSCLTIALRLEITDTLEHEVANQKKPLIEVSGVRYDDTRLELTFLKNNLHDAII